jgi:hypothetical protein
MGLCLEGACILSGEARDEEKREIIAKYQPRQRVFTLMCPLAPTLVPRFTVCDAFPHTANNPDYGKMNQVTWEETKRQD